MPCLTIEQLEQLARGTAEDPRAETWRRHLDVCDSCRLHYSEAVANEEALRKLRRQTGPGARRPDRVAEVAIEIEGYEVVREVGRGAQAVVYEAIQKGTKQTVALKVLLEGFVKHDARRWRFEREMELAARLKHPNIVTILHSGVSGGHFFLAMSYIEGQRLHEYTKTHELSVAQKLRLFVRICEAVAYAHSRGVIHRDIKPANILIDDEGEPHIVDFGLARAIKGDQLLPPLELSMRGSPLGTLPYMSPEQARGDWDAVDIRTDVYSLGVIAYEMLTSRYPYDVIGQVADVLRNIAEAVPTPPSTIDRHIDDEVQTILLRSLAKESSRRYASAGDLAADVARYLVGDPIEAKRDSAWYVFKKNVRRYRVPLGVAAGFVLAIMAGIVVSASFWRQAENSARDARQRATALALLLNEMHEKTFKAHQGDAASQLVVARAAHRHCTEYLGDAKTSERWAGAVRELTNSFPHLAGVLHTGVSWSCLAHHPDQPLLAAGSTQGVFMWNTDSGELVRLLDSPDRVEDLAWSPDGQRIVGSCAARLMIWNASTGEPEIVLPTAGHQVQLPCLAFSPDGRVLAYGGGRSSEGGNKWPGHLVLWSLGGESQEPQVLRADNWSRVTALAFSPDGQTLVSGTSEGDVVFWDVRTNDPRQAPGALGEWVTSLAFSTPDGTFLASGSGRGQIRLWDSRSRRQLRTFKTIGWGPCNVRFAAGGRLLIGVTVDHTLNIWDFDSATGATVPRTPVAINEVGAYMSEFFDQQKQAGMATARPCAMDAAGTHLATCGFELQEYSATRPVSGGQTIRLWSLVGAEAGVMPTARLITPASSYSTDLVFQADDACLLQVANSVAGDMRVWDLRTGVMIPTSLTRLGWTGRWRYRAVLGSSADGSLIAAQDTSDSDASVELLNANTQRMLRRLIGSEAVDRNGPFTFSEDGSIVAGAIQKRSVGVWNTGTGNLTTTLEGCAGDIVSVALCANRHAVATATTDGLVTLWSITDRSYRQELSNDAARWRGYQLRFSPDGGLLVGFGPYSHTIKVWTVLPVAAQNDIRLPTDEVGTTSVRFRQDGRVLICGLTDGTIALYNVFRNNRRGVGTVTFTHIQTIRGHSGPVGNVALSPDARFLASACSRDGMIKIWDLSPSWRPAGDAESLPDQLQVERWTGLTWCEATHEVVRVDRRECFPELSLSAIPPFEFPRRAERTSAGTLYGLHWPEDHPYRWLAEAEDPSSPARAMACFRLGEIYRSRKDGQQARKWFAAAAEAGEAPWSTRAQEQLDQLVDQVFAMEILERSQTALVIAVDCARSGTSTTPVKLKASLCDRDGRSKLDTYSNPLDVGRGRQVIRLEYEQKPMEFASLLLAVVRKDGSAEKVLGQKSFPLDGVVLGASATDPELSARLGGHRLASAAWKSSWAPDGRHLVFGRSPGTGLQIMNGDTQHISDFTSEGSDPAWSPDGRYIAFGAGRGGPQGEVRVLSLTRDALLRIRSGGWPSWDRTGRTLWFWRSGAGILATTPDDAEPRVHLYYGRSGVNTAWFPAISPDGRLIASVHVQDRREVTIVDTQTDAVVWKWRSPDHSLFLPAWSPDGAQLAAGAIDGYNGSLWILDLAAGKGYRIARGCYAAPAWSPDGTRLTFDCRCELPWDLWTIDTVTRSKVQSVEIPRLPPAPGTASSAPSLPGAPRDATDEAVAVYRLIDVKVTSDAPDRIVVQVKYECEGGAIGAIRIGVAQLRAGDRSGFKRVCTPAPVELGTHIVSLVLAVSDRQQAETTSDEVLAYIYDDAGILVQKSVPYKKTWTPSHPGQDTTPRPATGASPSPPYPDLLAWYTFDDTAEDRTGRSPPITLRNTGYVDGMLYVSGAYDVSSRRGTSATAVVPGLCFEDFTVGVEFMPLSFDKSHVNVLTGGRDYRWFGLRRSRGGNLEPTFNNQQYMHEYTDAPVEQNRWHSAICAVDIEQGLVRTLFDGKRLADIVIPLEFSLDVAATRAEHEKTFTFTNYSDATTFHGLADDLQVFGRSLSWEDMERIWGIRTHTTESEIPRNRILGFRVTKEGASRLEIDVDYQYIGGRTDTTVLIAAEPCIDGRALDHSYEVWHSAQGVQQGTHTAILAMLIQGETLMHLDNLPSYIDSPALASLLTTQRFLGRLLGYSRNVSLPNNLTIVGTGNNVQASGEIAKRIVPIMIEPASANPEARTDFQHSDIRAYVREQRRTVLECLLGLVENWTAAGRPKHPDRLGGFENWSETVGGILQVNGLRSWRTNEGEWRKVANPHGSEMETFVEVWHEAFGASEVTALDLMNLAEQNGLFGFVFARNGIAARGSVFGKLLTRHINAPIGNWRIRQRKARQALYRLEDAHGD